MKLKDWDKSEGIGQRGSRFRIHRDLKCPDCSGEILIDDWPPNYGGGNSCGGHSAFSYSQKCICLNCKSFFNHSHYEETEYVSNKEFQGRKFIKNEDTFSERKPLAVKGEFFLTPNDVYLETEFEKTGKYPRQVYG